MPGENLPRVYVTVNNGIAEVRAVDGDVEITLIDFDREGADQMTKEAVDVLFAGKAQIGIPAEFDRIISNDRSLFIRRFGSAADTEFK